MLTILDAHLHWHPRYDRSVFLSSLLTRLGEDVPSGTPALLAGFICLCAHQEPFWDTLTEQAPEPWSMEPRGPLCHAVLMNGRTLGHLFHGQQIVTAEGLEVLALGHPSRFPDRVPLHEVLARLLALETPAVIPWGAGKWLGQRGRVLSESLLRLGPQPGLFLADNPARPSFWGLPSFFGRALEQGFARLDGSDPMNFPGEEVLAGRMRSRLEGADWSSDQDPARALKKLLFSGVKPESRGTRDGVSAFLRRQFLANLKKG